MTCQIYQCEGVANVPFKACSMQHGIKLRDTLKDLKAFQNGELKVSDLYAGRGLDLSIKELEYYNKLI